MFNFALRRIQRFILPVKIVLLTGGLGLLVYLIINAPPNLGNILFVAILLFVVLSVTLSFFLAASSSLLAASAISFFLFLKSVDLLSPLNAGLFLLFLVLLGLYLWKK